jgi:hypothetical protein
MSSTSVGGGGADKALTRALDLFDSSASDEEVVPPESRRKHSRKCPPPKAMLKLSDASIIVGTSVQSFTFCLS